jgi:phosphate starvation-inducible PhoH-like protein
MSLPRDRADSRSKRKGTRKRNDEPLLRLTQEAMTRAPTKPRRLELKPLTDNQRLYDASIRANIITFGMGPAGTGKTWWAAARAAEAIRDGETKKIVITRPAVEAGEALGFLPGELDEKFEPYFRPVRDVFEEILGSGHLDYLLKTEQIEVRPLAYLRGASLKSSWIILDEAQNTTPKQMQLFLTRIGDGNTVVINGDLDQQDISGRSGLGDAIRRLKRVGRVGVVEFTTDDIVRSGICKEIVIAYAQPIEDDEGLKRLLRAA